MKTVPADAAPRQVRLAGALVGVQGLGAVAFVVALLVTARPGGERGNNVFGEAGYFGILALGVLAVAAGLILGKRGARTPATVAQILLLGVAWYAAVGATRFDIAVPLGLLCVIVLVLLFGAPARAWAFGEATDGATDEATDGATEEEPRA